MTTLTAKEFAVLKAIMGSEFGEHINMEHLLNGETKCVWSNDYAINDCSNDPSGITGKALAAVLASLNKKEFVHLQGEGEEATVTILMAGAKAMQAKIEETPVAKKTAKNKTTTAPVVEKPKRGSIENALARFHNNVSIMKNDCWEWTGPKFQSGYGGIRYDGKLWSAHRFAFKFVGENALPDKKVHRTCSDKFCVNPDHMTLGDKFTIPSAPGSRSDAPKTPAPTKPKAGKKGAKGRGFDDDTVRRIRVLGKAGAKTVDLAAHYKVSASTIRDILNGKTYKNVSEEADL
jgi:hypothetical protein